MTLPPLTNDLDFCEGQTLIKQHIQVGTLLLEIISKTDPYERMEALYPDLKKALTPNWSGGARCRVLKEATIQLNNNVHYQKQLNKQNQKFN